MNFIDIHCHILPGIDDGAQNYDQSITMAQLAVRDGASAVVATPHVKNGIYDLSKKEIIGKVEQLNSVLYQNNISLTILPGAEYYLEPGLPQRLADGELLTINNTERYILIELSNTMMPDYVRRTLYEIQLQGVVPIIAHPERNSIFAGNTSLLKSFTDADILTQVTSASITGVFGRKVQKTAYSIINIGAVHILASDGHSSNGRSPTLSAAYEQIGYYWGNNFADILTFINPKHIINGEMVPENEEPTRTRRWSFFPNNGQL